LKLLKKLLKRDQGRSARGVGGAFQPQITG